MSIHLQREINNLKRHLLSLSALVEEQVQLAVQALLERDERTRPPGADARCRDRPA